MVTAHRYQALDALRGICALAVAFFHYAAASVGRPWAFTHGSWLFVDFFFVLSGLVIAASYGDRLAAGFRIRDFMGLRLGRVYPLHLAVLLAMVAMEGVAVILNQHGLLARPAFSGNRSLDALGGSLALIHIFGIWPDLVWNGPSWSIACEVWAYLAFAAVCAVARSRYVAAMTVLAVAMGLWLAISGEPWLNRTFSGSLPRCLYGFGLGVLGWRLHRVSSGQRWSFTTATLMELTITGACIALVTLAQETRWTLLAPPLFLIAVLVFAREGGAVSSLLLTAPMRWLGTLSYSIYMIHAFVIARMGDLLAVAQRWLGAQVVVDCPAGQCFINGGAQGVLLRSLFLALLLAGSWLAWRLVEQPGRAWSRRVIGRAAARRDGPAVTRS